MRQCCKFTWTVTVQLPANHPVHTTSTVDYMVISEVQFLMYVYIRFNVYKSCKNVRMVGGGRIKLKLEPSRIIFQPRYWG